MGILPIVYKSASIHVAMFLPIAPVRLHKYLITFFVVALLFNSQAAALHGVTHLHVQPHIADNLHKNQNPVNGTAHQNRLPTGSDCLHTLQLSHFHATTDARDALPSIHAALGKATKNSIEPAPSRPAPMSDDSHTSGDGYFCHACSMLAKVASLQSHQANAGYDLPTALAIQNASHQHIASLSAQIIYIRGSPTVI